MTSPVNSIKRGNSRFYVDPISEDKLPSVTSVLNALAKPALKFWAAKKTAEAAVEEFGTIAQMVGQGKTEGAIDYLKRAPQRSSGPASKLGSEVHDLCDRIAKGEDLKRVHPDHQAFVDNFQQWVKDFEVGFLESEITVWSDTHGYAGTLDAICMIDGEALILDWKTGASGVWADVALQLNAYANADCILDPDGTRRDLPQIDGAAVLHLRPEFADLYPVRLGDDVFDVFKSLLIADKWSREISKSVLGKPIDPSQKAES